MHAAGNDFMQVWMNLWYMECFWKTNCWQELHFEYYCQNLNRNVQSPSLWWWLITQPRSIWKKAPPGLQRPSHKDSLISRDSLCQGLSDPTLISHLRGPFIKNHRTQLIIKQVKPGFTNYQPRGLAKRIWNSFKKTKGWKNLKKTLPKCQKIGKTIV